MNQPQPPMPQNLGPEKPAQVRPWLLIVFLVILLAGGGYLSYYFWGKSKTEITTTTPITNDETAGWKTYANAQYGYSFKHPQDWVIDQKNPKKVTFNSPQSIQNQTTCLAEGPQCEDDLIVSYYDQISELSQDINVKNLSDFIAKSTALNESKKIVFAGQPAYEGIEGGTSSYYVVYAEKNNHIYKIFLGKIKEKTELTSIEKQILSTFKFTAVSNDLTYTNSDYGFTMTFPASWQGYKMKAVDMTGAVKVYYCNFPTSDKSFTADESADAGYFAPFAIGVYTLVQWADIEAAEGPKPTVLAKNSQYVFTGSQANGIPPTDFKGQGDIGDILKSFKLK